MLEKLQSHGPMTISQAAQRQRRKVPGLIQPPPREERERNPRWKQAHNDAFAGWHRVLLRLERMELVRCSAGPYEKGKMRPPYTAFEITPLGTALVSVTAQRRAEGGRVLWKPTKRRVLRFLEAQRAVG